MAFSLVEDPFDLVDPLLKIMNNDNFEIQCAILPKLAIIVNKFNIYFKHEILGEVWDLEKFSIKEAAIDFDLEPKSSKMMDLTRAIYELEKAIMSNWIKHWREIKQFYEQVTIMMDGSDLGSIEQNQKKFEEGWTENSLEQKMQYFMFNRIVISLLPNLEIQIQKGAQ